MELWEHAGRLASARSANKEALIHLRRALELLELIVDESERARRELTLQLAIGPALVATEGWSNHAASDAYIRARELAQQTSQVHAQFTAMWGLWLYHTGRGGASETQVISEELLELAEQTESPELVMQAHHAGWGTVIERGDSRAGLEHVRRGLAIYDPQRHREHSFRFAGHDPGVCGKAQGAIALWLLGYGDQATRSAAEGLTLARTLGHLPSLAHAMYFQTLLYLRRGEYAEGCDRALALKAFTEIHGIGSYGPMEKALLGWAQCGLGDMAVGAQGLEAGIRDMDEMHQTSAATGFRIALAEASIRGAGRAQAEHWLRAAEEKMNSTSEHTRWPECLRVSGEVLVTYLGADAPQAQARLRNAVDAARKQGSRSLELRAANSLARALCDGGQASAAKEALEPVYCWFTEGFDTPDLREAATLLKILQ